VRHDGGVDVFLEALVHAEEGDTSELVRIGLPIFSHGTRPAGPQRLDDREPEAMTSARVGPRERRRNIASAE
jgi:hypothetical protein